MHREYPPLRRWIERSLFGVAIACFGWAGAAWFQSALYERENRGRLEASRTTLSGTGPADATSPDRVAPPAALATNDVVGILEIPRIGFSEIVAEGDGEDTLRVAIGHLPDTPLPWQPGNSALAGHRDAHFRPLKDVRVGDRLVLETRYGTLDYELRETMIVNPGDVWVLEPTDEPTLTLVTCYPFYFVGNAPKRFVIKATQAGSRSRTALEPASAGSAESASKGRSRLARSSR